MMTKQEYFKLLDKYEAGLASPEEERLLYAYYNLFDLRKDGLEDLTEQQRARLGSEIREAIDQRIFAEAGQRRHRKVKLWPGFRIKPGMRGLAVAAAAVAAVVFGVWFFNYRGEILRDALDDKNAVVNDIAPGKNGATLTLANGQVIQLSDKKLGVVVGGGIGNGLKYNDSTLVTGSLSSRANAKDLIGSSELGMTKEPGMTKGGKVQSLIASTAKGQTYQFTLPDGTKVWLNADSRISFPAQFSGKERRILLSGEGYFEVAKDKAHPFIVRTDGMNKKAGQEVVVLGTHFNITSYADEAGIKTTLLEGSVRINTLPRIGVSGAGIVIRPGEQATMNAANTNAAGRISVKTVDVSGAIDWKEGVFVFEKAGLDEIMRKLARWYDVEIADQRAVKKELTFSGRMSRYDNISKVLSKLTLTGEVQFKIEGKRVLIK